MLPLHIRLDLRSWSGFFKDASVKRQPHLTVFVQPNPGDHLRAAITVKKKQGGAVERAKTRRVLRSALVALLQQSPKLFNQSFAVVFLPKGKRVSLRDYQSEIHSVLSQLSA